MFAVKDENTMMGRQWIQAQKGRTVLRHQTLETTCEGEVVGSNTEHKKPTRHENKSGDCANKTAKEGGVPTDDVNNRVREWDLKKSALQRKQEENRERSKGQRSL